MLLQVGSLHILAYRRSLPWDLLMPLEILSLILKGWLILIWLSTILLELFPCLKLRVVLIIQRPHHLFLDLRIVRLVVNNSFYQRLWRLLTCRNIRSSTELIFLVLLKAIRLRLCWHWRVFFLFWPLHYRTLLINTLSRNFSWGIYVELVGNAYVSILRANINLINL